MGRPVEIKNRRTINIVVDGNITDQILQYIPKDGFSSYIRDLMVNGLRNLERKKEEAQREINPLGLPRLQDLSISKYKPINEFCEELEQDIIYRIYHENDIWYINRARESLKRVIDIITKHRRNLFNQDCYLYQGKITQKMIN
jgi:hypothetical protein